MKKLTSRMAFVEELSSSVRNNIEHNNIAVVNAIKYVATCQSIDVMYP